jgi:hypothetical protein
MLFAPLKMRDTSALVAAACAVGAGTGFVATTANWAATEHVSVAGRRLGSSGEGQKQGKTGIGPPFAYCESFQIFLHTASHFGPSFSYLDVSISLEFEGYQSVTVLLVGSGKCGMKSKDDVLAANLVNDPSDPMIRILGVPSPMMIRVINCVVSS